MKRVCVVTSTRAEYGLLKRTIQYIMEDDELELIFAVTGTHLSKDYGYTVEEIEEDGFQISEEIDIMEEINVSSDVCKIMGNAAIRFGEMFERQKPDLLLVAGDRYELLPICSSAMVFGIPIAHISGGEITEGAIDDAVRHCLTKMSYLHFPGCEEYRRRIIQLGEDPDRVFNYGDIGVENVRKMKYLSKEELEATLKISLYEPYAILTFHPVTLEQNTAENQTWELIAALEAHPEINFIVTMANADLQGQVINKMFWKSADKCQNIFCYSSLGSQRYLSLMKYAEFVIGNSSSGIVEAPCFGIPTINIGDRQKGRLRADSVIDCEPVKEEICRSMERARTLEFKKKAASAVNPYGDGDTARNIVDTIRHFLKIGGIELKKNFYDMEIKDEKQ